MEGHLQNNPLDLERCFIGVNFFVKFTRSEVTAEHGLRDDVGRFGVTDEAQGFECSIRERGLEFVIQRIVGDSVCDHDDGVAGEN